MSMVETNIITTAIEGLGGGINEINANMNAATVDSLPGQVVTITSATKNATLVDVSGKGTLHYVFCNLLNPGGWFKIEIDGRVFYAKNAGDGTDPCGYFAKDAAHSIEVTSGTSIIERVGFPSSNRILFVDLYHFNSTLTDYSPLAELAKRDIGLEAGEYVTCLYYTQKPLRFETSLKITFAGAFAEASAGIYIKYTLDD